jgi:hypothetical protein
MKGGVGATFPPRASFFGVRSLSLVLADFGTLLFCLFLVLIFYSLSFLFVLRYSHFSFGMIRIRARASKLSKGLGRRCAI